MVQYRICEAPDTVQGSEVCCRPSAKKLGLSKYWVFFLGILLAGGKADG